MSSLLKYVDPGTGFVFAQNTAYVWSIIAGLLGTSLFFFKIFFKRVKKFPWIILVVTALVLIGIAVIHRIGHKNKVLILGIDALDPEVTERLMREGKLPHLTRIKETGSYSRLTTTVPSESVVAWTSFLTGTDPGQHGICDFIMRDPSTYRPYLSLNEISHAGGNVKISVRRKGEAFWSVLSKSRVPCYVYFCPTTFPPEPLAGRMLSGMGTPDIAGNIGRFSFYTTKTLSREDHESRGRIIRVTPDRGTIHTGLYGPKVSTRSGDSTADAQVPFTVTVQPHEEKVQLRLEGRTGFFLKKGGWSGWEKVSFRIGPFTRLHGIVKFYLKSIEPDFELYASPINFDPEDPPFPISYPSAYSKKVAGRTGLYHTQGMPHDTWALTEDRFDEKAFLEHVDEVLSERERILKSELKDFKGGMLFFYFDTLDIIQHMFWRYTDPRHPLYEVNALYKDTIARYYEKMDAIIGEVLKGLDEHTTLIVASDHGFGPFRRAVHLNRWLLEKGYLSLKEGVNESKEFFADVDWSKTKAYALGFGGIYLNEIGRERYGIVESSGAQELKRTIAEELKKLRDPATGEPVVNNVFSSREIWAGSRVDDMPDLFVGFKRGYRASWQTALGGVPSVLIEDNKRKWSGDHLIDPSLVPGVLFVNKKVAVADPSIIDIAPTVLTLFGIPKPAEMRGRVLLEDETPRGVRAATTSSGKP